MRQRFTKDWLRKRVELTARYAGWTMYQGIKPFSEQVGAVWFEKNNHAPYRVVQLFNAQGGERQLCSFNTAHELVAWTDGIIYSAENTERLLTAMRAAKAAANK